MADIEIPGEDLLEEVNRELHELSGYWSDHVFDGDMGETIEAAFAEWIVGLFREYRAAKFRKKKEGDLGFREGGHR